jgi:hypothetical protein
MGTDHVVLQLESCEVVFAITTVVYPLEVVEVLVQESIFL